MTQRLLNVRVRPARIAVLISNDAVDSDLLIAFEFFSKLWGGRFGQLLAVDSNTCDDLTEFRLGDSRPDFVYGIGLDDDHWKAAVHQACQPRRYCPLKPEYVKKIKHSTPDNPEHHYLVDHALIHLFSKRDPTKVPTQTLRLVKADSSALAMYCAATYGVHHQNLRKDLFDQEAELTNITTVAFVELATEFVKECQQSWLDVTGHALQTPIRSSISSGRLSPTVVLVDNQVKDLSLF